ncbi:outer membrane protein [Polycladidibacter stylochi]|uniref:outer membrane protein n=1 Tax=Polycladidibacter stylochi TaxID=1807766 RepID=UPI00082DBFA8|nr:outer membrane beta-barrel protein [Pseudovibrio stylochi]
MPQTIKIVLFILFLSFSAKGFAQEQIEGDDTFIDLSSIDLSSKQWEGWYMGLQAGYAHIDSEDRFNEFDGFDGIIGGIFAGYNYVYKNVFFGPELEANYWNFDQSSGTFVKVDSDYMLAAKLRGGIVYGRMLAYISAGVALSQFTIENESLGPGSDSQTVAGLLLGGGAEVMIAKNLAVRLDYSHIDYNDQSYTIGGTRFQEETSADIVRVGLSYRFHSAEYLDGGGAMKPIEIDAPD